MVMASIDCGGYICDGPDNECICHPEQEWEESTRDYDLFWDSVVTASKQSGMCLCMGAGDPRNHENQKCSEYWDASLEGRKLRDQLAWMIMEKIIRDNIKDDDRYSQPSTLGREGDTGYRITGGVIPAWYAGV